MKDEFWLVIARLLPQRLVYWCAILVAVNATTGEYSSQIAPDLRVFEAVDRWPDNRGRVRNGKAE